MRPHPLGRTSSGRTRPLPGGRERGEPRRVVPQQGRQAGPIGGHDEQALVPEAVRVEHEVLRVGAPRRVLVGGGLEGQPGLPVARPPGSPRSRSRRSASEMKAMRVPSGDQAGSNSSASVAHEEALVAAVGVHHPDVALPAGLPAVDDLAAVGRPVGRRLAVGAVGQLRRPRGYSTSIRNRSHSSPSPMAAKRTRRAVRGDLRAALGAGGVGQLHLLAGGDVDGVQVGLLAGDGGGVDQDRPVGGPTRAPAGPLPGRSGPW